MSIYDKLGRIQRKLISPKDNKNSFGGYNYRSCEDILKVLKPLCDEEGCVCYITNALESIGGRNYVKATVRIVDLETGTGIESSAHAREEETKKGMDGSQITGASSSYARKYALAGLFCIDNEKDSDATNDGKTETKKTEAAEETTERIKAPQVKAIRDELERTKVDEQEVLDRYKVTSLYYLPMSKYDGLMKTLKGMKSI